MKRLAITPKDIQIIEGKSERFGRNQIKKIKAVLNKEAHQIITIEEYCNFMGLEVDQVILFLGVKK